MLYRSLLLVAIMFLAGIQAKAEDKVALTSYYIPGLVESADKGIMVDMLREIERQSNLTFDLTLMPTARVQHYFANNKIYSYFPELEEFRPKNSCRSDRFMQKAIIAVNLKEKTPITDVKQLEGLRVGAVTGYSYGLNIINNPNIDIERVENDIINIKKLFAGRIDAIVGDIHSTIAAIEQENAADKLNYNINKPVNLLDVFFVFPQTEQGQRHCQKVSEALENLRQSGHLNTWFGYQ